MLLGEVCRVVVALVRSDYFDALEYGQIRMGLEMMHLRKVLVGSHLLTFREVLRFLMLPKSPLFSKGFGTFGTFKLALRLGG